MMSSKKKNYILRFAKDYIEQCYEHYKAYRITFSLQNEQHDQSFAKNLLNLVILVDSYHVNLRIHFILIVII